MIFPSNKKRLVIKPFEQNSVYNIVVKLFQYHKSNTMKNFSLLLTILLFLTNLLNTHAQEVPDSTGFEGDHFSLEGAMDLFKNAQSIEEFEKQLNQEENHVNNLDLDKKWRN